MQRSMRILASAAAGVAILLIEAYRLAVRPLLIGACKFHPTCSEYAIEALRTHGLWHGGWLATRRILRCHPFTLGGIDPVPEAAATPGGPDSQPCQYAGGTGSEPAAGCPGNNRRLRGACSK